MARRFPLVTFVVALILLLTAQAPRALCFNFDTSFPRGIYRLDRSAPEGAARGSLVLVCRRTLNPRVVAAHHALGRAHCASFTEPLLKMVVGVAGDTVELTSRYVKVNGVRLPESAPRRVGRDGALLPQLPHTERRLGPSELWLYAPVANSWDSRYFGPVGRDEVHAVVRPLWVWRR